jgi:hypothetical protein
MWFSAKDKAIDQKIIGSVLLSAFKKQNLLDFTFFYDKTNKNSRLAKKKTFDRN